MLRKKEAYTVITPIPSFIPRQLALDILHSHSEVITLNPLVLSHKPIPAPRNAASDEFYSTWYEITERVQVLPGAGRLGSSKIVFNGCFHDMPWGIQTHIYAPFNIDLRNKYRIGGNMPGIEPPEVREIGLEAPKDGLYLREDIEIRCNISLTSFVKAQLKAASKEMVDRIIRKAELLDSGALQAMMAPDGRLKTVNPNDRSQTAGPYGGVEATSPTPSSASPAPLFSRPTPSPTYPYAPGARPPSASPGPYPAQPYQAMAPPPPIPPKEQPQQYQTMELPGDYYYANQHPQMHPVYNQQNGSATPVPGQQQQHQQQNMSPPPGAQQGYPQPPQGYPNQPPGGGYYAELPTHTEKQ